MQGAKAFMTDGYDLMISEKEAFLADMDAEEVEVSATSAEVDQFFYEEAWKVCDQMVNEVDVGDLGMALIEALRSPALAPGG